MPGKQTEPREPGRRWWEIRGKGQPDEGSYRELLTDSRGRSRLERSLSAGADPSDAPPHPLRGFLWPIASLVAAALLIVVVIYGVSPGKARSPTLAERAVGSSGNSDAGVTSLPSAVVGNPPPADGAPLPPTGGLAAIPNPPAPAPPRTPETTPRSSETTPNAPVATSSAPSTTPDLPASSSDPTTSSEPTSASSTPTSTPTASTPSSSPAPAVTLAGPAPAAPGSPQDETPVSGTGGCVAMVATRFYACTIAQTAPVYRPGTTERAASLRPNRYPFLCQADGSNYSVGQRANHWWAWAGNGSIGVWTPAVFLAGGPDDAPEPGLPVCGSAPTTTTSPAGTPTEGAPTTTPPAATSTGSQETSDSGESIATSSDTTTGVTTADSQPGDEPLSATDSTP